jgi:hypothetical protein
MASAADKDEPVSIGRVFSRAFGALGGNPVPILGIAFLFGALPTVLLSYASVTYQDEILRAVGELATIGIALVLAVTSLALGTITQGALVRAAVAHGEGREASFAESASAGLAVALPLIGLAILFGLGVLGGLIFLVVPGIIFYVVWSVAAPALVEERLGVIEAFRRSRDLTRGARWKVFGLLLVVAVLSWLFALFTGMMAAMFQEAPARLLSPPNLSVTAYALNSVSDTISLAVWGVIQSSLYVELRDWKDGPATDALADIFA